jgi:serine/threonine-protein kinase
VDPSKDVRPPLVVGRYEVYDALASGGMATVHIGRLNGPVGFSRTVAVKILHRHYAADPEFVAMFVDEARLAARIRHPNVVSTLDVVSTGSELVLVMEYIAGETLGRLLRGGEAIPKAIVSAIVVDVLDGLHAAHEAKDELGEPLRIVHRDVSPQNVIVGADGVARVLDFGIAKATMRQQSTGEGQLKGKLPYMSPEQITRQNVDRRTDVFAAAVVLWEALTRRPLFHGDNPGAVVQRVLKAECAPPSTIAPGLGSDVDEVVLRGLCRTKDGRYPTAHAFARELERVLPPARRAEVAAWVHLTAHDALATRAGRVAEIERGSASQPRLVPVGEALTTPGGPGGGSPFPMTLPRDAEGTDATTTSDEPAAARPRSRWAPALFAVAAALLASVATAVAMHPSLREPSLAQPSAPPRSLPEAASTPLATASSSSTPPSSESARASEPTVPAATTTSVAAGPHAPPRRATTRPPRGCDPPYTFNDAGVKRWKEACL